MFPQQRAGAGLMIDENSDVIMVEGASMDWLLGGAG